MKRRWWTRPLLLLGWFYVLMEFITYDVLRVIILWFAQRLPLRPFESWVRRQGVRVAFVLLLMPTLFLVPIKFLEVWLFMKHHYVSGVFAMIGAKLVGTAFVAYLFSLTKPALMTLPRFVRFYAWMMAWRQRVLDPVLQSRAYQRMRVFRRWLRSRWVVWRSKTKQQWWGRALGRLRYSRKSA